MMGRSRASNGSSWRLAAGTALFLAVVAFASGMLPPIRAFFLDFVIPRNPESPYAALSRGELEARLSEAEARIARIGYRDTLYTLLAEENASLRETASVESFSKTIPARVIARPPRTHYDSLVLDKGSVAGIKEHALVVVDGVLLGTVAVVGSATAQVELFSSPGSAQDVLLGEPRAVAVAYGLGGGAFELQLPKNVTVTPGEAVRVPHSETLMLGTVVSFESKASDATQTVHVRSPVSVSAIDYVSIIPTDSL